MSAFNQKYTRALHINASPYDIPYPNLIKQGATTAATGYQLIDNNTDFIALGVSAGDIVYNPSYFYTVAKVLSVGTNNLILSDDIFTSPGEDYEIYSGSDASGLNNRGCTLMITCGITDSYGYVTVETIGGDIIDYIIDQAAQPSGPIILPFQIKKFIYFKNLNAFVAKDSTMKPPFIAMW